MANFFASKSITEIQRESKNDHTLKRTLTATKLIGLGIGAIIGAGIFVLTGKAAAAHAGPAIVLSFVLGGIVCSFAGLCYAEMASAVPISGSAYTYAYATMGELVAWIIGWDLILEYLLGATTVAIGWSGYMTSFLNDFGLNLPVQWTNGPGSTLVQLSAEIAQKAGTRAGWADVEAVQSLLTGAGIDILSLPHMTGILNLPAMFIMGLVTVILMVGMKESAVFNNMMVLVKLVVVLLFIGAGCSFIDTENWGGAFIPTNTGVFGEFGWSGILRGAGLVFFAYIGFDAVSTTAQEAKNPQRDLPIGILGSLVVCTILYVLVAFVLTGVVSYRALNVAEPIAVGIDAIGMAWLSPIVKVGAIAGLSSVILVTMLGQTRIFYSMARDGLLPAIAARVHPRFGTPMLMTAFTGGIGMLVAGLCPIYVIGELVSIGTLFAFVVVCIGVMIMRRTHPDMPRSFRVPAVWITAPLGTLSAVALMLGLPLDTWIRLFVWLAIGIVIYFAYGVHHSKLQGKQKSRSVKQQAA